MQIIINKTGEVQEVTPKVASRLINKGKAHPAQMGGLVKEIPIPTHDDLILNPTQVEKLKEFSKPQKRSRKKKSKVRKWNG